MSIAAPAAPGTTQTALPEMSAEDKQRSLDIVRRRKAFAGQLEKPFKRMNENDPDFNILDNRCAPVVLKGMSFLFGQPLKIEVSESEGPEDGPAGPDDETGTAKAQDYLEDALGDIDDFMTLLSEAAINGGITGHCFVKLLEADSTHKYPRLSVIDPANVWVETQPDDCRAIIAFNIQYQTKDKGGRDIWMRQRIWQEEATSWTLQNYWQPADLLGNAAARWQPLGEPIDWPWPFPPIAHCPNMPNPNEFWGMPDLTDDFIAMNRHLNLINSNIAKLLYFYGHPYIFADGGTGSLDITPGKLIGVGQGVTITAIQASGDLANARAFAADLRSDMDELSRVPAVALGRLESLPRGQISGVALQLLFQPLLEKTSLKRRLYGRMIRDVCQRILCLGDFGDGENLPVELHWPELMPVDELQTLQALLIKQQLDVSQHTIFTEMNLDYDEEMTLRQQEAQDQQASFNAGTGAAPQAIEAGKTPQQMPPEMQQNMQQMMQGQAKPGQQEGQY